MAALTPTAVTKRFRLGDRFLVTVRATSGSGANAADEWIAVPGLSLIDAIVGWAFIGTAPADGVAAFKKNAQGTGQTEGAHPGDLGAEFAGASAVFEVTVIGRP